MSSDLSSASSPDALGPEGDALYLISSPAPEYRGRQSWVPEYRGPTPRRSGPGPAPRRTPKQQSARTMRFDDIVLPSSPHPRSQRRSISPAKMQSEGNLSPWKIRVTVEAEHEDDENAQDGPRKRLKPSTITTKVPLKDEDDHPPSAKKRRGRPRKSDIQDKTLTPIKGSPGRTPKLQPPDSIKRPRGRPRKSVNIESVTQSIEASDGLLRESIGAAAPISIIDRESPTLFTTRARQSPSVASPEPDPFLDMAGSGAFEEHSRQYTPKHPSPSDSSNMNHRQNMNSSQAFRKVQQATPQASVSPLRELRGITPENTLHAGHTPRPVRRSYPTPTSSSLVDGNGDKQAMPQQNESVPLITDPTDVHHEYDTIMESEDFSMVSLDTLPSVKQAGLSSTLNSSKGELRTFAEKRSASASKETRKKLLDTSRAPFSHTQAKPSTPFAGGNGLQSSSYKSPSISQNGSNASGMGATSRTIVSKPRKRLFSLASMVRLGLSLQSALIHPADDIEVDEEEIENASRRLKNTFRDLDDSSRRRLEAGVNFGKFLARRAVESRKLQNQQKKPLSFSDGRDQSAQEQMELNLQASRASSEDEFSEQDLQEQQELSRSQRLEREWERQRELVSQQINMAGSDNVIVLDSDDQASLHSESGLHEQRATSEEADDMESYEELDEESDDDFGDVWQEEARKNVSVSSRRPDHTSPAIVTRTPTDQRTGTGSSHRKPDSDRPYRWDPNKGEIPPLGKSRTAQLRDTDVDLSLLLKPRDTPKSRQYYANSPQAGPSNSRSGRTHVGQNGAHREESSPIKAPVSHSRLEDEYEEEQNENDDENQYEADSIDERNEIVSIDEQDEILSIEEQDEVDLVEDQEEDNDISGESSAEDWNEEHNDDDGGNSNDIDHVTEEQDVFANLAGSATTPLPMSQGPKQSWFRRITNNFTPGWWTSPKGAPMDESQSPPLAVHDPTPSLKRSRSVRDAEEEREEVLAGSSRLPAGSQSKMKRELRRSSMSSSKILATSGYFTDAHYVALKRLYQEAKRHPERFPYHATSHREEMLGDSLWTSDGEHGLPIAKIQFSILDRFVSDLISADIRHGGRGQIGWSEDDLHKRLFSIIVGDEIRRERKAQRWLGSGNR